MEHTWIFLHSILTFYSIWTGVTVVEGRRPHQDCIYILSPKHSSTRRLNHYGIQVGYKLQTFLGRNPEKFRLVAGGFKGNRKDLVAIESISHPGFYLRHKNYKFHLEKPSRNELFSKDATFHLVKLQDHPVLYAFELSHHPSWFVKYDKNMLFKLSLGYVKKQKLMDSTSFVIKQVRCKRKGLHNAQKKTVIVGSNTIVETDDADDDDSNDSNHDEVNDVLDDDTKVPTATDNQSNDTVIKEQQGPSDNTSQKEQDILTEIKRAFKVIHSGKNQRTLSSLQNDIKRKVNILASELEAKPKPKINESNDVVIKIEETEAKPEFYSGIPEFIGPEDTKNNDTELKKPLTKTTSFENASNEIKPQGKELNSLKIETFEEQHDDKSANNTPINASDPHSSKNGTFVHFNDSQQNDNGVEKGSPKLVDEESHFIDEGTISQNGTSNSSNKTTNKLSGSHNKQSYMAGIDMLMNLIKLSSKSGTKEQSDKTQDNQNLIEKGSPKLVNEKSELIARGSVARNEQEKHEEKFSSLVEFIQKASPRRVVNVAEEKSTSNNITENLHNNTASNRVILFSEKCDNVFPEVCEKWAQKRYCLTFNELMKRYCRRACKLCDHVMTTGFTACDRSCGGGIRLRMIKVSNRQVLQRRACNTHHCPIDGGYTPFSNFSECSATPCGSGLQYQHRTCTQPPPQFHGRDCSRFGSPVRTRPCYVRCQDLDAVTHSHKSNRKQMKVPRLSSSMVKCKHQSGSVDQERNDKDEAGQNIFGSGRRRPSKDKSDGVTLDEDCAEGVSQTDYTDSNLAKQGMYEYAYQDGMPTIQTSSAPQNPLMNNHLVDQAASAIGKALDEDSSELERSSLLQEASESPNASLSEELAAEHEEEMNEKRYEESVARQSLNLRPY